MTTAVLTFTDRGIYCPAGDFFIDPWRPVDRALITHGHADHARPGHGRYLATDAAGPVMRHRLGDITLETIAFGETRRIGDAEVGGRVANTFKQAVLFLQEEQDFPTFPVIHVVIDALRGVPEHDSADVDDPYLETRDQPWQALQPHQRAVVDAAVAGPLMALRAQLERSASSE